MPHVLATEDLDNVARRLVDEAFDALTAAESTTIPEASASAR